MKNKKLFKLFISMLVFINIYFVMILEVNAVYEGYISFPENTSKTDKYYIDPEYIYLNSWQEALSEIKKIDWSGILIKGSNSIGLSNIVKAL